MTRQEIKLSFKNLEVYCSNRSWYGWDPYDGLNSRIFKKIPVLKNIVAIRIMWIQFFKHNPINFRRLFMVPKGYNTKGLALFLTGYCNIYKYQEETCEIILDEQQVLMEKIDQLANLLLELQTKGYSGSCWGYNFDWQSIAFFLPDKTPTVVATSFVVESLINAYEVTANRKYLDTAISSASFIKNDLNRIKKERGFMFSYSPLDNRAVYNATLLGTKTLSLIYKHTGDMSCKQLAYESALAVCDQQNEDGSFPHSDQIQNKWRDNFHTAFKLESLSCYQISCSDKTFDSNLQKGYVHWINNFFDRSTGLALYYENNYKLVDLHCAAQALPALYKLSKIESEYELATKIVEWTIRHMQDKKGYFYFQRKNKLIIKIPYMRWPNAWMFYGMSYYLRVCDKEVVRN